MSWRSRTPDYEIDIDRLALESFVRQQSARGFMKQVGNLVRDRARANVPESLKGDRESAPEKAIEALTGQDGIGAYVDVGYLRNHPGFYLWWWEVGTQDHPASPHLRPALTAGVLDGLGPAPAGGGLVDYTTRAGVTRQATRAQVANWTRGSR